MGNAIAYVDNDTNIFYRCCVSYISVVKINFHARPSNGRQTVQLTKDGGKGLISHGIPDWVYEEEVFEQEDLSSCLWWSTGASNLAYASFYDAKVNRVTLNR